MTDRAISSIPLAWLLLILMCGVASGGWFQVFSESTTVAANASPVLLHPKQFRAKLKAEIARLKKKRTKGTRK